MSNTTKIERKQLAKHIYNDILELSDDAVRKLGPIYGNSVTKLIHLSYKQFNTMVHDTLKIDKIDWYELERFWEWNKVNRPTLQELMDMSWEDWNNVDTEEIKAGYKNLRKVIEVKSVINTSSKPDELGYHVAISDSTWASKMFDSYERSDDVAIDRTSNKMTKSISYQTEVYSSCERNDSVAIATNTNEMTNSYAELYYRLKEVYSSKYIDNIFENVMFNVNLYSVLHKNSTGKPVDPHYVESLSSIPKYIQSKNSLEKNKALALRLNKVDRTCANIQSMLSRVEKQIDNDHISSNTKSTNNDTSKTSQSRRNIDTLSSSLERETNKLQSNNTKITSSNKIIASERRRNINTISSIGEKETNNLLSGNTKSTNSDNIIASERCTNTGTMSSRVGRETNNNLRSNDTESLDSDNLTSSEIQSSRIESEINNNLISHNKKTTKSDSAIALESENLRSFNEMTGIVTKIEGLDANPELKLDLDTIFNRKKIFKCHSSYVTELVHFKKNRKTYLASGSYDKTIKVWADNKFSTPVATLETSSEILSLVTFEINGVPFIASAGDCSFDIEIWNMNLNELDSTLVGHRTGISSLYCFNKFGIIHLVSSSGDQTIKLWDISTRTCSVTFQGHSHYVMSLVVFYLDGKTYLVTGSIDHSIKIWDVGKKSHVVTLTGHTNYVNVITSFSKRNFNKAFIVSGSADKLIKVWVAGNDNYFQLENTLTGHLAGIYSLKVFQIMNLHKQKSFLLSGSRDNTIRLWDLDRFLLLKILYIPESVLPWSLTTLHNSYHVDNQYSSCGIYFISGHNDGTILLWT